MESPAGRPRASPRECGGRRQTGQAAAGTAPDARSRPAFWLDEAATLRRPRWRHGRLRRPRRGPWLGYFAWSGLTIRTARLRRLGRLLGALVALEALALERSSAFARSFPLALRRDRSAIARAVPFALWRDRSAVARAIPFTLWRDRSAVARA